MYQNSSTGSAVCLPKPGSVSRRVRTTSTRTRRWSTTWCNAAGAASTDAAGFSLSTSGKPSNPWSRAIRKAVGQCTGSSGKRLLCPRCPRCRSESCAPGTSGVWRFSVCCQAESPRAGASTGVDGAASKSPDRPARSTFTTGTRIQPVEPGRSAAADTGAASVKPDA